MIPAFSTNPSVISPDTEERIGAAMAVVAKNDQRRRRAFDQPYFGGPNSQRKYDHDEILELLKSGMTPKRIAQKLGCSPTTVTDIARANGVRLGTPR